MMNHPSHMSPRTGGQQQGAKDFCHQHLYQMIQIENHDGSVHAGILHSFDDEQLYLLKPAGQQQVPQSQGSADSRLFFPFFGPFGLFGFPFWGIRRFGPFYPYYWY
ncbi:hypothetical protein JF544_01340 [Halobacillus kuroshimensis]|uniref:Uncharacterized protein n=1 Tax=Halobacillus kuroshimensis TaxID=302481 RepID=A0ABS3DRA1_9BACI|nr:MULTISPECIES: hypothetical protein [Halobacillus]MBN8233865.1 hypothetical protein [Halobacillus kuroshimensis]